jgi:hypothetical protein
MSLLEVPEILAGYTAGIFVACRTTGRQKMLYPPEDFPSSSFHALWLST